MSESTAIEKRPVALGAPMADLDSAFRLAKNLAVAALMPDALRGKPSDVLAIMLYGQDLGLSPMQAIQGVYVVKGKPHLSGTTWIALARQRGHNVYIPCRVCRRAPEQHPQADGGHAYTPDHDATRCTVTVARGDNGQQHTETFTIEDAKTAKLLSNDIWSKYPKRMLLWRAAVDCLRFIAPEIALGFYTEGDDLAGSDVETVVEQVADEPLDVEVVEPPASTEPAAGADEVSALAAQFDFSTSNTGPGPDYACICGAVGQHFEDECPQAVNAGA